MIVAATRSTEAILAHRLQCRAKKVRMATDYMCRLEDALDRAAELVPTAIATPIRPAAAPPHLDHIALATDANGNRAVVWLHDDIVDVLVTLQPGFDSAESVEIIDSYTYMP